MRIVHRSRRNEYRNPYGALPAGTDVQLALTSDHPLTALECRLVYAYGRQTFADSWASPCRVILEDNGQSRLVFQIHLPLEPCLFFYWFELSLSDGPVFLIRDPSSAEGDGILSSAAPAVQADAVSKVLPWQITVYDPGFTVPDWLPGTIIYQIFPDRYARTPGQTPVLPADLAQDPSFRLHADWDSDVDYQGVPPHGYQARDFFGGTLRGIIHHLDEIAELGCGAIYLNPVFSSSSNHRYDTADYMQIDPLLGTEADFRDLCSQASARGIRIILDGVFNHTGSDSRYFNREKRFSEPGAWQQAQEGVFSPYSSWFRFERKGEELSYDSWWGFPNLPNVNEDDLSYRAFITGSNGVIRYWQRQGASGWRIDVADELPDNFLRDIRTAVKAENKQAVLLGEVWEDASNKISYGEYRDFLLGRTFDQVMNYPFARVLVGWLRGRLTAGALVSTLETLREHYPPAAWLSAFNLISSHDLERAITALAGEPDPGSRELQAQLRLSPEQRTQGLALIRLAVLFQMFYPGCPTIYYGDELGMEGYRDPFNRRPFRRSTEHDPLRTWFVQLGQLRRELSFLRDSQACLTALSDDLLLLTRTGNYGITSAAVLQLVINRSGRPQVWNDESGNRIVAARDFILTADTSALAAVLKPIFGERLLAANSNVGGTEFC